VMPVGWKPHNWPIGLKVPILVALLMLVVSALISERVLNRLARIQEQNLQSLAATYLDGLSAALLPHVLREDVWEVFDILDRSKGRDVGLRPLRTVVTNSEDQVIAASDPKWLSVQSELPPVFEARFPVGGDLHVSEVAERAYARRVIMHQGRHLGSVFAEIDIAPLLAERRQVLTTLLITNSLLALVLAAVGYFAVRRLLGPVKVLARHLDSVRKGAAEPIPASEIKRPASEFGRLFRRYNAMVRAMKERQSLSVQLAEEERLASLGRLASGMAHEINNPLGGMLNAVDAIKRHGERASVRRTSVRLLEQGLGGIRDVVRAALLTYRGDERRPVNKRVLEDLRLLIRPELKRKRLKVDWKNGIAGEYTISADAVRQIALNMLLNACAAAPEGSTVGFSADVSNDRLVIVVRDEGSGLPDRFRLYLEGDSGSAAPIQEGKGLGLWMIRRLADELQGVVRVCRTDSGCTEISLHVSLRGEEMSNAA
jgi:signal transduction histidine kinase